MDQWLHKVEALIAKADSTDHPAEAEAFMAKAQELMRRHAIDQAMLDAASGRTVDEITSDTITVEAPYASAKQNILGAVASAQNVRAVQLRDGRIELVGFRSDIDATVFMYGSLATYAVRVMLRATVPEYESARAFRHAFLLGFAGRMHERFTEANRIAQAGYEADTGQSAALVLVDRKKQVDADFRERYPRTRTKRSTSSSHAGRNAGRQAANSAAMGRGVGGGAKLALGS